jgi:hypothetical protein
LHIIVAYSERPIDKGVDETCGKVFDESGERRRNHERYHLRINIPLFEYPVENVLHLR